MQPPDAARVWRAHWAREENIERGEVRGIVVWREEVVRREARGMQRAVITREPAQRFGVLSSCKPVNASTRAVARLLTMEIVVCYVFFASQHVT